MIFFAIHFLIGFIVFFFQYKKNWKKLASYNKEKRWSERTSHLEHAEGWRIYIYPLFWEITIPLSILWKLLEIIYNKTNKNNQTK